MIVNPLSLVIPTTGNVPLNPEFAAPTGLFALFTLLILILSPTLKLCGFSVTTVQIPAD